MFESDRAREEKLVEGFLQGGKAGVPFWEAYEGLLYKSVRKYISITDLPRDRDLASTKDEMEEGIVYDFLIFLKEPKTEENRKTLTAAIGWKYQNITGVEINRSGKKIDAWPDSYGGRPDEDQLIRDFKRETGYKVETGHRLRTWKQECKLSTFLVYLLENFLRDRRKYQYAEKRNPKTGEKSRDLEDAILWKYRTLSGIKVGGGKIQKWPESLGPELSEIDQAELIEEYRNIKTTGEGDPDRERGDDSNQLEDYMAEKQIIEQKKKAVFDAYKEYPEEDRLMIDLLLRQGKEKPQVFEEINAIRKQAGKKTLTSGAYDTRWCRLVSRLQNDCAESSPMHFEPVPEPDNETHPGNQ